MERSVNSNDSKPNNAIYSIIILSGTLFILTSSILLITYLALNSYQLPYKYQSNFWIVIIIIAVIIDQLYTFIIHVNTSPPAVTQLYTFGDELSAESNTFIVNAFFIHPLIFISVITRAFSISKSIKFNTDTLRKHINDRRIQLNLHSHQYSLKSESKAEDDDDKMSSFFKKKFRYPQIFIALFGLISVFFVIAYYTNDLLNCLIAMYNWFYPKSTRESETKDKVAQVYTGLIIYFVLWYSMLLLYITLVFKVCRYNMKRDLLKIKFEFGALLVLFYIHFNIKHIFKLLRYEDLNKSMINYDSGFNALIILLYIFLSIWRYCSFKHFSIEKVIDDCVNDDEKRNERIYALFKGMIDNYNSKYLKYLLFCDEYNEYRTLFKAQDSFLLIPKSHSPMMNSNNADFDNRHITSICSKAKSIIAKYYSVNPGISDYAIDFPYDIKESAKHIINNNNFDYNNYYQCFDDSYLWIKAKLVPIINEFKLRNEDMNRLERMMFFIECYEI